MLPQAKTALMESAILRQAKADLKKMMRAQLTQFHLSIKRRLRVLAQPAFVLLLAACFVFATPLAGILRNQIAQAWMLDHQPAAAPAFASVVIPYPAFSAEIVIVPADPDCVHVFRDSSLPALAVPTIHDIVLTALPVLAGFVLLQRLCALPLLVLLPYRTSPPTPPPRHCAA